jgi:hypothetical protein
LYKRIQTEQNISAANAYFKAETDAANWIKNNKEAVHKSKTVVTIPVVIHVVYNVNDSANQNIPDSVIYSQIAVLNEDYRKLNANYSNIRSIFDTISADIEIEFCLATKDPDGNYTTGITRTPTTQSSFDLFFNSGDEKRTAKGGKDPWPTSKYLNIWSSKLTIFNSPGLLGYAQFPGGDSLTDGVSINYQHFGRTYNPAVTPNDLGRTTTHEVGHWLGLRHTWGDGDNFGSGTCDSTDYVDDTPRQKARSQSDCDTTKNSCSNESLFWNNINPPDMVENYMDYSNDACMCAFTNGQKERMWSFLNTSRLSLQSSDGCEFLSVNERSEIKPEVRIFPNPATDELFVFSEQQKDKITYIKVMDITGKIIFENSVSETGFTKITLSDFSNGIYFVQTQTILGSTIAKFIKQ